MKGGTSWISRKGQILEKGGMNPRTNYVSIPWQSSGTFEFDSYMLSY